MHNCKSEFSKVEEFFFQEYFESLQDDTGAFLRPDRILSAIPFDSKNPLPDFSECREVRFFFVCAASSFIKALQHSRIYR